MGRTSKFSFPVPSRTRNRNSQISLVSQSFTTTASISEPVPHTFSHKLEQILSSGYNPNSHRRLSSQASSLHWKTASNSNISITISESTVSSSTTSTATATTTSIAIPIAVTTPTPAIHDLSVDEDYEQQDWDDDSAIAPNYCSYRICRHASIAPTVASIAPSDAASILRRSSSNATITSYYDKSKAPLSISQQTSSSAMAKGLAHLPTKAQAVLDIEGNLSSKRKPSKLNFSNFVRGKRSHANLRNESYMEDSASPASTASISTFSSAPTTGSTEPSPAPSKHRFGRKFLDVGNRRIKNMPSSQSLRSQQTTATEINHLYDHYERMVFQTVPDEEDNEEAEEDKIEVEVRVENNETNINNASDKTQLRLEDLEALITEDMLEDNRFVPQRAAPHPPQTRIQNLRPLIPISPQEEQPIVVQEPEGLREFFNTDVPLSTRVKTPAHDDCNASFVSRGTKASKVSRTSNKKSSLVEADLQEKSMLSLSSDSEDDSVFSGSKSAPQRASICTSLSSDVSIHTNEDRLTRSPSRKCSGRRPSFAPVNTYLTIPHDQPLPRMARSGNTPRTPSSSCSSPQSPTAKENYPLVPPISTEAVQASSNRCASTILMMPSPRMLESAPPNRSLPAIPQRTPSGCINPDVTPPMSPDSVEFFVRPLSHASTADSRIMQVTRQEELLLAALRQKRARMRENIISELEEEGVQQQHVPRPLFSDSNGRRLSNDSRASASTVGHSSRRTSFNRGLTAHSSSFMGLPLAISSMSEDAPPPHGTFFPRDRKPSLTPSIKKERIMLFLNPPEEAAEMSDTDLADDSEDDDISCDDFFRMPEPPRHQYTRRPSATPTLVHTPLTPNKPSMQDLRVNIRVPASTKGDESEVGIPRPDSPISPADSTVVDSSILASRKAARLSAVGSFGPTSGPYWGDDD